MPVETAAGPESWGSPARPAAAREAVYTGAAAGSGQEVAVGGNRRRGHLRTSYRVVGVGDIMMGSDWPTPIMDARVTPTADPAELLGPEISALFRRGDVVFGNVEGTIHTRSDNAKACGNPSVCFTFRSPPFHAHYLRRAGFTLVSNANNHSRDFGEPGRADYRHLTGDACGQRADTPATGSACDAAGGRNAFRAGRLRSQSRPDAGDRLPVSRRWSARPAAGERGHSIMPYRGGREGRSASNRATSCPREKRAILRLAMPRSTRAPTSSFATGRTSRAPSRSIAAASSPTASAISGPTAASACAAPALWRRSPCSTWPPTARSSRHGSSRRGRTGPAAPITTPPAAPPAASPL